MLHTGIDEFGNVDWSALGFVPSPSEGILQEELPSIPDTESLPQAEDEHRKEEPEDDFRFPASTPRKRRRPLEDEPEAPQPRKVHITEQTRAQDNARYARIYELARRAVDNNPWTGWVQKEVAPLLYRGWVDLCTELAREIDQHEAEWAQLEGEHIEQRRRWEEYQLRLRAAASQLVRKGGRALPKDEEGVAHGGERQEEEEEEEEVVVDGGEGGLVLPNQKGIDLSNDHVFPAYPNLDAYREHMPGDSRRGVFHCDHCLETFEVARDVRLHFVDEHLYMTGAAGPAGTLEYRGGEKERNKNERAMGAAW
jgi:hypothetical protein